MLALFISLIAATTEPQILRPFSLDSSSETKIKQFQKPTTPLKTQPYLNLTPLADLIGAVESDTVGGYNAANGGSPMDLGKQGLIRVTGRRCEEVTIGEIKAWQRRGLIYAVGRYQIIPKTMVAAVRWANLSDDDYFTPTNQDKLLLALLKHKRPAVWAHLKHGASLNAAVMDLAKEWAGLPTLDGHSFYGGGNRSHASVTQVVAALEAARAW
jgi:hypothetical protein